MHCPIFSSAHVMVLGDVMLDKYIHGDTFRISPEAPVPVVNIEREDARVGGAANVAVNLTGLGAQAVLVGAIGLDESGNYLREQLMAQQVNCHLIESSQIPTTTKTRVIGRHQQLIRLDSEKHYAWSAKYLMSHIQKRLSEVTLLLISDYAKGMLAEPLPIITFAKSKGLKVVVDPKNKDFSIYAGAHILTPNFSEFEAAVGPVRSESDLAQKALALMNQYDFEALLVTCGAKGMTLVERQTQAVHHIPAQAREVFDVTGAGDTVVAVLAACLCQGMDYLSAAKLANVAAGISVGILGTAAITRKCLQSALGEAPSLPKELGVVDKTNLLDSLRKRRRGGQKIVMTNGCFDLLHTGHLNYLQEAKALGDCLVVAVNDDASVKRLKGDSRPLNTLRDRMLALAALKWVDYVVSFSEDTPQALITEVLPDILVKGGDYTASCVAGAKEVLANGGMVKILSFVDGYSTSKLIDTIHQSHHVGAGELV